jgi:hypothetical protein
MGPAAPLQWPAMEGPVEVKQSSARAVSFKLAAALENYELDIRALVDSWWDTELVRRVEADLRQLTLYTASLPRLSVSWAAVLLSRAKLLKALCSRAALGAFDVGVLHEHLSAVEGLRRRCLRLMGAQCVVLA